MAYSERHSRSLLSVLPAAIVLLWVACVAAAVGAHAAESKSVQIKLDQVGYSGMKP